MKENKAPDNTGPINHDPHFSKLLSKNEKIVLNTLDNSKYSKNLAQISRSAELSRTTTKRILDRFTELKIARKTSFGGKIHWIRSRKPSFSFMRPEDVTCDFDV